MFSPLSRGQVQDWLIEQARADPRIAAAAVVGSGAGGRQDEWSDIDLALRLAPDLDATAVADGWAESFSSQCDVVDSLDIWTGQTLFRVFLLSDTLQVDLSFWTNSDFAKSGGAFRLVFGEANAPVAPTEPDTLTALKMGWLYALHVRSSLARGRWWQTRYMIDGMRERVVEMACARNHLPAHQGRGVDDLPADVLARLTATLVGSPSESGFALAFGHLVEALLIEAEHLDEHLAARLRDPLLELAGTRTNPGPLLSGDVSFANDRDAECAHADPVADQNESADPF